MSARAHAVPDRRSPCRRRGAAPAVALAAVVLAWASCASPRFDDCEVRCLQSGACPSGLACGEDGYCYREGGDGEEDCAADLDAGESDPRDGGDVPVTGPAELVEVRGVAEPADVARREPTSVTSCIYGGDAGRDVEYSEAGEEVRSRDVVFPSYDEALALQLELPDDPELLDLDVAGSFDIDPSGTVSSADGIDVLSTTIPAQSYGVYYRQAIEVHHVADLVAITAETDEYTVGQVAVVDWRFEADLGIGDACPPFPPPPPSLQ